MEIIAARVRARASEIGVKPSDLQKQLSIAKSSFDNYWGGTRVWPTERLGELSEKLDTTVDSLLMGAGSGSHLDLVSVNEIDMAYGLGGTYTDVAIETQTLHFPRAWLETITSTPAAMLTFVRGRGDSMQPTLQDDDIVLIDRSVRTVREQDVIWAITIGDIAMIKRLRIKGDRVSILSDNDRIPADDVHHEEINVVGRVIFIGRKI